MHLPVPLFLGSSCEFILLKCSSFGPPQPMRDHGNNTFFSIYCTLSFPNFIYLFLNIKEMSFTLLFTWRKVRPPTVSCQINVVSSDRTQFGKGMEPLSERQWKLKTYYFNLSFLKIILNNIYYYRSYTISSMIIQKGSTHNYFFLSLE